ncbi:MAG TPA: tRNA-intron lyase [Candidatus Aenigmarchaeota archaeon]|nr:MAG: tRNA-intron lyase [Candidatus Aenigmarchaeota archaeon]HDD46504.1 tRNA-intron lyase [Candidatus Aenigmarchaeota archaeon]
MKILFSKKSGLWVEDKEAIEKLRNDYFGEIKNDKLFLFPEEALYLVAFRNFKVYDTNGMEINFNSLAAFYSKKDKNLFVKFNAYRDWRDRGLVIRRFNPAVKGKHEKKVTAVYPSGNIQLEPIKWEAVWYPYALFSIIEDKQSVELYERYWFGQYGVYKQKRGTMLKLNFLETIFLAKHFGLKVKNSETNKITSWRSILNSVVKKREYAKQLYEVYEDWRLRGYIVKTGFKFGSHFRIYFPGASPVKKDKWTHSKHVLHVFPKQERLLVSEWARAVRVAHGVKKTFILGIPEMKKEDYIYYEPHFLAYRRKKERNIWVRETPKDKPRYLLVALNEDEHIGGIELASLLKIAKDMGLVLVLSITDRETAVTYYMLKKIILPDSKFEYYEIEWMKP